MRQGLHWRFLASTRKGGRISPVPVFLDIPLILDRLCYRYPSLLLDTVVEHDPGTRMVAVKNVTANEEYFQGHFPGTPLMPAVMMIESLAQVATLLLLSESGPGGVESHVRVILQGVNGAKFRRQVLPGDQLRLEVVVRERSTESAVVRALATTDGRTVAEADLLIGFQSPPVEVHETAVVDPRARLGHGTVVGPYVVVGPDVTLGKRCRVGASAVIDGCTELGDDCQVFPFASIGLIPQDLKFKGEETRLVIGERNLFREGVTINRGTRGGGGLTQISDDNVFMAYVHVAHDCVIGDRNIFGPGATLGGHVVIEDDATVSAYSGVQQYCRVGRQAFIGGYSAVTKDALPYGRTVGNRARLIDLNTIGLMRRECPPETIARLRRAYRYLLQSKLNTTQALDRIQSDATLSCSEVDYLLEFIRSSKRGVSLHRRPRRMEPIGVDE